MAGDAPDIVKYVVVVVVIVAVGVPVITTLAADVSDVRTTEGAVLLDGNEATLGGSDVRAVSVQQSLGTEAALTGEPGSGIKAPQPDTSGPYTLSTIVEANRSAGPQIVYADQTRTLFYEGGNWTATHYNSTTDSTWHATVNATSDRATVQVVRGDDDLTVYEDGAPGEAVVTDAANETVREFTADNLDGALDETRVIDERLNASERQQLIDRPTAPHFPDATALRVMYDSYDRTPSMLPAFYVGGDAAADGITLVDGVQGEPAEPGADYELNGDSLTALGGGSLDGAPAAYVSWTATFGETGPLGTIIRIVPLMIGLLVVGYIANRIRVMTR